MSNADKKTIAMDVPWENTRISEMVELAYLFNLDVEVDGDYKKVFFKKGDD